MNPTTITVDSRYSVEGNPPTPWDEVAGILAGTEIYALTTLMPDGAPHTVPVSGIFDGQGFLFCTGQQEQKTRNIGLDPRGSVHIGSPKFFEGIDVVVRGSFTRVTDRETLTGLIEGFVQKYGEFWRFDLGDDALINDHGNPAWVFRLLPDVTFSFTRGDATAQTKYEFDT